MLKKIINVLLCLILLFVVTGCDKKVKSVNIDANNNIGKTFVKTYEVVDITDIDDEYVYLTLKQFQFEEVANVKVDKNINSNISVNKNYEFTFEYTTNSVSDNIESIFKNTKILSIEETDKVGLEQIQDVVK